MKIRDIVNREIVNLTNCEHEPIHIPGSIQPHGFLLGLRQDDLVIDYCSANAIDYIQTPHTELLGRTFGAIFGNEQLQAFRNYTSLHLSSSPLKMNLCGEIFNCTIHLRDSIYILEAEPVLSEEKPLSSIYDQTSQFLSYMHQTHTLRELCQLVAEGTREITGYDRVMIYRFDKHYNGEVFAESCNEDLEPFLGLHYPHTDIPVQARELYLQNLLRLIVDINYTPVPLYTIDDAAGKNLDLGHSILRSTSPIHIQYLQNMGVGATLTISLIHQKKLWGLIACHHYSAKNLSPEIRLAAQLQGNFLTSQIDVRQSNEEYEIARKSNAALEKMNALGLSLRKESFADVIAQPEILALCNASGVSVLFNDNCYSSGLVPSEEDTRFLARWLFHYTGDKQFHTDKLLDFLPERPALCQIAPGVVYHSLGPDASNCVIWFRKETVTEVHWGGDPNKAIEKDENGLSPRKSFLLWKEFVKYQSKPWLAPELNAAANYAHSLQRHVNLILLTEEGRRNRELNEILRETNSELENINWISTHDLQEPLRKIQLIASRILSKEQEQLSAAMLDSLQRMNNSANRMQTLLIDILKYTRIQHTKATFEPSDLNVIAKETVESLSEMVHEASADIRIDALPEIQGIPFLLRQLFSNLISNAIKYARPGTPPNIHVAYKGMKPSALSTDPDNRFHVLTVSDNGIGFDPKFAESIFNIFTRLHSAAEYKGSGVGLALCKKIMQAHKGHISAEGVLGEGAVFTLWFPVVQQ